MGILDQLIAAAGPGSLACWEAILSRAAREAATPADAARHQHHLAAVRARIVASRLPR